jgi:hypothetical protein
MTMKKQIEKSKNLKAITVECKMKSVCIDKIEKQQIKNLKIFEKLREKSTLNFKRKINILKI